jgi:membrane-associated phospholipid phosphatase
MVAKLQVKLPLFINAQTRLPAGVILFFIAYILYFTTNHYPAFPPKLLPMTFIDEWVPFLPWSVIIYVSEYLYFVVIYLTIRDFENLNKYFYSFFCTQALSCAVFYFFPTIYPRENFPIPSELPEGLRLLWTWLRTQDAATNCFPSLHVSTVYLSAFLFRDEQQEKYPFFLTWGTLIALSTLPTKQHYLIDVVAGYVLAVVAYVFFHRWVRYGRQD